MSPVELLNAILADLERLADSLGKEDVDSAMRAEEACRDRLAAFARLTGGNGSQDPTLRELATLVARRYGEVGVLAMGCRDEVARRFLRLRLESAALTGYRSGRVELGSFEELV
jgi:hypothetical protein